MGLRSDEERQGRTGVTRLSAARDTAEPMRDYTQDTRAGSAAEMRYTGEMTQRMAEKHPGLYRGPKNQTLVAGHGERKQHENEHPAIKMCKGKY